MPVTYAYTIHTTHIQQHTDVGLYLHARMYVPYVHVDRIE